jgi:hypothetical protein
MPPKCRGALCHGLCVGVRKHLVSVKRLGRLIWFSCGLLGATRGRFLSMISSAAQAWVDWSDFSVAYWGRLQEGSFRWSAQPLIQDGHYGRHLGFRFCRLEHKRLGRLIRFFCGLLGVIRGRFLSMISSAAHPRWPPSWIWFPLIFWPTPGSTGPIFGGLIGGDWRKVPFNDQLRHSSKMAAHPINARESKSNLTEPIQFYVFENRADKTNFWCTAMKSDQIQENRLCPLKAC